ncbi:MAG: discoidin domain-containing protein [Candidatus Brocadiia bacterium]
MIASRIAALASALLVAAPGAALAADVGAAVRAHVEADWLARDARFAPAQAPASKPSDQVNRYGVTTAQDAAGGCDGVKNGRWGFHVASKEAQPWWQVDLGKAFRLDRVVVYNRTDRGTADRTRRLRILVAAEPTRDAEDFSPVYEHDGSVFGGVGEGQPLVVRLAEKQVTARVVRLAVPGPCSFALDEVEVYPADAPDENVALDRPADQKSVSRYSYPGTLPKGVDSAPPPRDKARSGDFALAHTRQVLDAAAALADRLRPHTERGRLEPLAEALDALERRLGAAGEPPREARRQLYLEACRLRRRIAFANPLLDFDRLLFIKRHDPGGPFHMCDQYYGCNAKPGGGLYVLEEPFGPAPRLRDLLADSVVGNGRLKGQKLAGGSFLSPEVSFDGKTILFAYSQAKARKTYTWDPACCYHIFKVHADGSGLVQLTDGPFDDFDPCFLPNGRIAFISLRRGGYLRCGRHCPVYTLHSMEPDGSDIVALSMHETHEWHPSVDHNGMLVYTRWDYVDRDTNVAHHIWLCHPDGRDPRSYHGNYPLRRGSRPWMEMSIRAVPGSHKYVAVAAAHHGHAFGSLVLIDQRLGDDRAMSQLERLTPDAPFPEAEGRPIKRYMRYGTPWPLSEDDYLCVYDREARNRGIYWLDREGNRELVYRDPRISCLSPIPLRPRPRPPVLPAQTTQMARAEDPEGGRQATLAVMNVYDADFQWPPGTRIEALRIVQLLPKSTAPPNKPRIGVGNQTNARAVLGTVPVEPDGSVYCQAPVGTPIYFQALDERGLAVMSMRSVTYVHPGERLTCQGCHERKRTPPHKPPDPPLALRRPPSPIEPDVEGSNPFNYARLVQPALDRHCVACHRQRGAIALDGAPEGKFTRSYNHLAGRYGFYFHVSNGSIRSGVHGGSRTIPGEFGARAAPLLDYLGEAHYGVDLPAEDFHRITLWLDCNSEFYGAYEKTEAQRRGELVEPSLE